MFAVRQEKLAEGLQNLEALRAEANAQSQSEVGEPRQPSAGPQEMEVEDPAELISQLRAQVASLQAERQGHAFHHWCLLVEDVPRVVSDMMSSLIEAANSTLKDAADQRFECSVPQLVRTPCGEREEAKIQGHLACCGEIAID